MYRMHIHVPTENRYIPIDYCMELGTVTNVAIENLMAQMEEIESKAPSPDRTDPAGTRSDRYRGGGSRPGDCQGVCQSGCGRPGGRRPDDEPQHAGHHGRI